MLKLAAKMIALAVLLLAINLVLAPLLPYPWGHPQLRAKLDHWRRHNNEIDTLFLGSSWTYRQISPRVFDRETAGATRSFNLAADGVFYPQLPLLLEHLDAEGARPKLWIVELSRMVSAVDPDLGSTREEKYWLSPAASASMIRALFERPDKSLPQKGLQASLLALQLAERTFHVGLGADAGEYFRHPDAGSAWLGPAGDGYYPVELQVEQEKGEPFANAFLRDPAAAKRLDDLKRESQQVFEKEKGQRASSEYLRELSRVIAIAEKRQARLVFVVPPRLGRRYELILPVARALPPEKVVLELADPRLHPELYELEMTIDHTHLNRQGAELYSAELARILQKRDLLPPSDIR